jgi:sarcosine/dimethylglycine N-methyltransferase
MRQDERERYDRARRTARTAAYSPGDFVEQESFMRAGEILSVASRAGIGQGVSVLDLCCGVGGPGRFITSRLGCTYLGVDMSISAIEVARVRATGLSCRFEVAAVPPIPSGPFDVLLETMLAVRDKQTLLREVSAALVPGGRFAFTVEEGRPLTGAEKLAMPHADTVWLMRLDELLRRLASVGLEVRWVQERTRSHRLVADALTGAFFAERSAITAELGEGALDDLLAAHRLWSDWMTTGRVRKFAIVAAKTDGRPPRSGLQAQHHTPVGRAHLH